MAHPLLTLARKLEQRNKLRRNKRDLKRAITDPHVARDVGLPYHPKPILRTDQW